jgi:hypothetical protein
LSLIIAQNEDILRWIDWTVLGGSAFVMWFDDMELNNEKIPEAMEFYSIQLVQAPHGHVHRKVVIQHRLPLSPFGKPE